MKKNLTEIVCIIDNSGSMGHLTKDVIGGINSFIESQKAIEGEANFTMIYFESRIYVVHDKIPMKDVPLLDESSYYAMGGTAMYDGIGYAINSLSERIMKTPEEERPEKVLFCIMTDGEDNESREFKSINVKHMVQHQTDRFGWEFVFMAANINVEVAADMIGIRNGNSYAFSANSDGVSGAYATLSSRSSTYRSK